MTPSCACHLQGFGYHCTIHGVHPNADVEIRCYVHGFRRQKGWLSCCPEGTGHLVVGTGVTMGPIQIAEQPPGGAPVDDAQARAMAQVCLDLLEALGVRWGENPYETIARLQGLRTERDAYRDQCELLGARNAELRMQLDETGVQLECGACGSKNAWGPWTQMPVTEERTKLKVTVREMLAEASEGLPMPQPPLEWRRKMLESAPSAVDAAPAYYAVAAAPGLPPRRPRRSQMVIHCDNGED